MIATVNATDLSTRYETRNPNKAIAIGGLLVDQGYEAKVFTYSQTVLDVATGVETTEPHTRYPRVILRTNAPYSVLAVARATYRNAEAAITADAIAAKLAANA